MLPNNLDNQKIKDWGSAYVEEPKDAIWNRIESKLDGQNKSAKRFTLNWKRYVVAANLIILAVFLVNITDTLDKPKTAAFSFNVNQKPLNLEEIQNTGNTSGIYSIKNIQDLNDAYAAKGF
jgi:hypothetical protein